MLEKLEGKLSGDNSTVKRFKEFLKTTEANNVRYTDIPEFFLCRITDDLMRDPVMLSSGFSYEREAILKHFKHNGHVDPLTRETVLPQVCENRNLK